MTDLIDTTEMYLRTILELEEEGIVPLRARISERLSHSGPTVSQTIARMERDGLVIVSNDRHLELTGPGRSKAVQVMRKHRLAERLLADVIGLEWEYVHEEACRWEHVMSEQVERKLISILGNPTESPYGNPIPGLDELGALVLPAPFSEVLSVVALLRDSMTSDSVTAKIKRLAEPLQVDPELLVQLSEAGIRPGAVARFTSAGDYVRIEVEPDVAGGETLPALELAADMAAHIFVLP